MILKLSLTMFALMVFSGCTCEPIYVEKIIKVSVPIKCSVPDVNCTFKGNDTEVVAQMIGCIYEQKEAAKVCR